MKHGIAFFQMTGMITVYLFLFWIRINWGLTLKFYLLEPGLFVAILGKSTLPIFGNFAS
jgi:hypothetical protein